MRTYERNWWWVKETKQMALVLFMIVTMMLHLQMKGCVGCLETERMGLLQLKSYLKNVLNVEEESFLKSWSHDDLSSDCCHWKRVKCSDAIGGQVVHLSLDGLLPANYVLKPRGLNLSLLHSFPRLQSFNFSFNRFSDLFDPINGHKSFQRLEKLRTLDFFGNRLRNSVFTFLSAARSLRTLSVGRNLLNGVFPPNELENMTELRVLDLKVNRFSFFSAQGLINLRELEVLDLSHNNINDSETDYMLRTTKLKTLDLRYNELSEASQLKVLKYMPMLQELDLSKNGFTDLDRLGAVLPSSLHVLNLAYNQLSSNPKGYLEICALMNLRELDLRDNALTNLPYCLGNLSHLRTLDLSENQMNGALSSFVSGLPSALEYLSLLDNNFDGSFWFSSLVNHTRLTVFKLSSKLSTIQAQAESSWLPQFQLKMLKLKKLNLGSTIPSFLAHQHDLRFIHISYSQLKGAFPGWLVQNNTKLEAISLNNNLLTELRLPRLVHGLQVLDISSNMIYDSLPEDIGLVFPHLRYMNFSSNHNHGTIPSSMGEMKSLRFLDMSSNRLYGQLPKTFLSGCYSLIVLKLSNNQLQGKVFPRHANLTDLGWLFLDGNRFDGSLEEGLLNLKSLTLLDISDNRFSGTLPFWIGKISGLTHLYMKGNKLKGHLPHQLQNLPLQVVDMSHNSFSGSIPGNLTFSSLRELRLHSNEFIGSVPSNLFNSKELQVLDLRHNNLSGMILNTIGKTSNLRFLLLRNNSFQTHIPEEICQLSEVALLDLSHNNFKGVIPSCFGKMSFGAQTDDGMFSPYEYVSRFQFLQRWSYASALFFVKAELESGYESTPTTIVNFLTKSRYEAYQGDILQYMHGLDLSSNELSGRIPVEVGDLQNIRSLNLSRNRLTGSIPGTISKLKNLESLDISNNKLSGSIPPVLADLSSLGYFNISYNNLSGEIPFKGHLVTFDETSYRGNVLLCGLPTNKSCNPERVLEPSVPKQAKEEEGDGVIDMVWFYWTCGAVYISTLLALFAFLCIDSRWSREWFYRVDLLVHHLQHFKDGFVRN